MLQRRLGKVGFWRMDRSSPGWETLSCWGSNRAVGQSTWENIPRSENSVAKSQWQWAWFLKDILKKKVIEFSGISLVDKEIAQEIPPYFGVKMKMQCLEMRRVATMFTTHWPNEKLAWLNAQEIYDMLIIDFLKFPFLPIFKKIIKHINITFNAD